MKYTVILGRPIDATECAYDTYMTTVDAPNVKEAQRVARAEAAYEDSFADPEISDEPVELCEPDTYEVIAVIEGEHWDVKEN